MPTWITVALSTVYILWSVIEISVFTQAVKINKRRAAIGLTVISYGPIALTITVCWLVTTVFLISHALFS